MGAIWDRIEAVFTGHSVAELHKMEERDLRKLDAEIAAADASVKAGMFAGDSSIHGSLRLPQETKAVDAANRGAAKEQLHPAVRHSELYQMEKLRAEVVEKLKVFEVELDDWKKEIAVKYAKKSERAKQQIRRERERERRAQSAQADNRKDVGADIPDPERTTER